MSDNLERGSQLKGYIQREIRNVNISSNYGYNYYFTRDFLERLYERDQTFVMRGSVSQFCNIKKLIRPITDMDIVTFGNIEEKSRILESTFKDKNKISYEIKNRFVTTNATINYRVLCHFDNIQHLISIDLKNDKQIDSKNNVMPTLFSKDQEFNLTTVSLEEHLANKLYISLLNLNLYDKLGKQFRRFKDFYDIYHIMQIGDIDLEKVKYLLNSKIKEDEFLKNFQLDSHMIPDGFREDNQQLWEENRKKYQFDTEISLDDVVTSTEENIRKIL